MRFLILFLIFTYQQVFGQQNFSEQTGDALQIVLPVVALGSTFIYKSDDHPTCQFVKAYALSLSTTYLLKYAINKTRPNGGQYGFPSGHTTSAFTGAAFLQRRYGLKIGIPAYILAGYVGFSRIEANKHDVWDVLAGASIGIGSNLLFTRPYQSKKINVTFNKLKKGYLLNVSYQF
jgi:hypothetical protein